MTPQQCDQIAKAIKDAQQGVSFSLFAITVLLAGILIKMH